ncbi:chorismate mutase [Paenibacillus harenae]|uniref:chorismate mutase n=1 Tax=Paenibacillus harenae TaxID=306543 RepID=A0ABT9TVY5_PAEHA|nr:chorismate mutase [Paenibacillus harenae]MDQ0058185.1 chorismate mutase [Paenibacillus harenae]MDQ0111529.1 chorismate mutase [Paenibacillus harenae]
MSVRGIRGAITVELNDKQQVLDATIELLHAIIAENGIVPDDVCSVFITVTNDLDEAFPAKAIRETSGWELVPLMCALEVPVIGSLERCIRFMLLVNTDKGQADIKHVYLGRASVLRPDLSQS